jgi:hypothetical protein
MKNPFANLIRGFFGKKEQPKAKTAVTPSLNPVTAVKKIFMPKKGVAPTFRFESQELAIARRKRKVRNRMQKHSRRVNYGLA